MDCSDFSCNQNMDYRHLYVAGGDHVTSAQANANYFYQLYLWWWHTTNAWHAPINPFWSNQSVEPVCECTESYLNERNDCDAYQNSNDRVIQTKIMQCEYCPQVFHTQLQMRSRTAGESMNETFSEMWLNDEAVGCEVLSDAGNVGNGDDYNDEGDYDEDDDDDDDIGIEVDDHFRKFLEESEKHRQEREKRKQEISKEDDYIEVGSIHRNITSCPPSEQPGAKRKEEMKLLYGKQASLIMSLEASLQINYNKNCDIKQPVFWPSIPLKF